MKKDTITEEKAKKTPAGGVIVGKREGQTIIHDKGTQGGYFVGKLHKEGGIKGINKSTGQPIEVQGGEVIITAPAVADQTKREFEGEMLTNREILSKINERGGGVSLENGGEIYYNGSSYNYGGKTMTDYEIMQEISNCGCDDEYKYGGKIKTYKQKYNKKYGYPANESHDLEEISKDTGISLKGLQQIYNKGIGAYKTNPESVRPNVKSKEQWAMARVYSAVMGGKASKIDANELKMNYGGGLSRGKSVEEIADMHNVSLSSIKKELAKGIEVESEHTSDEKLAEKIAKDHLVENPNYYTILDNVGLSDGGEIENLIKEGKIDLKFYETTPSHAREYGIECENPIYVPLHITKENRLNGLGKKTLKYLDDYCKKNGNDVIFGHVNNKVEFTKDERTNYLSDVELMKYWLHDNGYAINDDNNDFHKVVNVKYNNGGQLDLVKESKKGDHPARDLNNYNDLMDVEADGMVGAETGLYADGGSLDFLDDAVSYFTNGGSTKEVVDFVTIWDSGSSLRPLQYYKYETFEEFRKAIALINPVGSYVYIGANDKMIGRSINVRRDGKNTVATFNPNTATPKSFLKAIERSYGSWRMEKFDFDKWLGIKSKPKTQATTSTAQSKATANVVPSINLSDKQIEINGDIELAKRVVERAEELGWTDNKGIKNKIRDNDFIDFIWFSDFKYVGWGKTKDINITEAELFGSGSQATTNIAPSIDLSNTKIWIGNNPELSKRVQEKAFELGFKWTSGSREPRYLYEPILTFSDDKNIRFFAGSKEDFDKEPEREIFESDLFDSGSQATSSFNVMNLTKERIDLLFDILQYKNTNNLEVFPANIVNGNSNTISFVDVGSGDVFEFNVEESQSGDKGLFPINEKSSKLAFDFFEYEKQLNQMVDDRLKKEAKLLFDENVADLDKLAVKYQDLDFEKEKKDLEALSKLLPAFQGSKNAIQRSMIIKEMDRLNRKITYEGFILFNEQKSGSEDLFTPQGLLKYYWSQSTQSPVAPLEPPCELPTPNGQKSKLPLSAYLNARTPQFKKWFGDWEKAYETNNYFDCSKYIDEETKEPKIFYHGVRKFVPNFGAFSNMGQGVVRPYGSFEPPTAFPASYFSDKESYANFYAGIAPNMPKPSDDYQPFVYKVFIKAKNPLSLVDLGFEASYKDLIDYILVAYGMKISPNKNVLQIIGGDMSKKHPVWVYIRNDVSFLEIAKDYGYDSLIQIGDIPVFDSNGNVVEDRSQFIQEQEFLTFYPNQIKSATVKKSFYFDFFKDIRFNKGGYVRI